MANKASAENWDDLRYFLAVVRSRTLSAAAEVLDTEHTTVARHVRALEERLGARLFVKSNTGYRLTAAGERLQALAQTVERAFMTAKAVASDRDPSITGSVRVGTPDGLGTMFLAQRLRPLLENHAALNVELIATTRIFNLARREADIYISISPSEHARVSSRRLTDYRLFVYGSADYLKRSPEIRTKDEFSRRPFIDYVDEFVFFPELDYFSTVGLRVKPRLKSSTLMAQVFATLAGAGLCVLPAWIAATFPSLVAVLPHDVSFMSTYFLHIHDEHRQAPHVRAVADFIASEMKASSSLFLPAPDGAVRIS
ncbi:MAG TPA: LysR family transcriptional regulator [Candidatus Acidoferrum sp.]|nr:LysR family transcriptional regulator [Candidatus Acidoferrum sp.]